jgi:O-antigen/teichoic acid export membrane protein
VNGAVEAPAIAALFVGAFSVGFLVFRLESIRDVFGATRRALAFSIPFVAHYVSYWVQSAGDRWVITLFSGDTAIVGRYYLAVQLMSPVSMVIQAWSQGIWPPMGRVYRDEGLDRLKAGLGRYQKHAILLSAATAVGIHLCMPVLTLVVGPKYLGALSLMPWLGVIMVMDSLYYPAQNVIYYAGRSKLIPLIASTTTFGGLAISAALVPRYGVSGLLAGRMVGSFVAACGFSIAAARVTDAGTRELTTVRAES